MSVQEHFADAYTEVTAQSEWARCRHWIQAALARSPGFETIEDVERKIYERVFQFWPGKRCAVVTEVQQYPRKRALCALYAGGDLVEMLDEMEPALCAFARAADCDLLIGLGRKGWERVTAKRGYRLGWQTVVKNLRN